MKEDISLDIAMSKEEMNKIKDILGNAKGLRHYWIKLKNGEYLDLVEYKDYEKLETNWKELKKWLEELREECNQKFKYDRSYEFAFKMVLDKMQEIESGNDD